MSFTKIPITGLSDNVVTQIQSGGGIPKITSIDYPGDDTAALPAGGQTVTINGSNFSLTSAVYIDGVQVGVVSYVDANTLTFVAPAKTATTHSLYVVNPDGATAIAVPGITYSNSPVWSTSSGSLGTPYETASFSVNLSATGDGSVTYALSSGNTLPSGITLAANGLLSGTIPATDPSTTYTFYVDATDSQNQETSRSFSVTYTKDEVTWSSPANGAAYTLDVGTSNTISMSANSAAGKSITYSVQSGSLPANVSISGSNITGAPNTTQTNTSVVIRATAADTLRYADLTLYFEVVLGVQPATVFSTNMSGGNHTLYGLAYDADALYGFGIYTPSDGNSDNFVFKYDLLTNTVSWVTSISDSQDIITYGIPRNMVVKSGGLYLGTTTQTGEYNNNLFKINKSTGSIVWQKEYDSLDYSVSGTTDNVAGGVVVNSGESSMFAAGGFGPIYGFMSVSTSSGSLQDVRNYSVWSGTNSNVAGLFIDSSDNIYAAHTPNAGNPGFSKINSSFAGQWGNYVQYGASYLYTGSISVHNSSGSVYTVYSKTNGPILNTSVPELLLVKFNSSGVRQWHKWFARSNGDNGRTGSELTDLLVDQTTGDIFVLGRDNFDTTYTENRYAPIITKFNSSGDLQWSVRVNHDSGADYSAPYGCAQDSDNIYFCFRRAIIRYPKAGGALGSTTVGGITYTFVDITYTTSTASITISNFSPSTSSNTSGWTTSDGNLTTSSPSITITPGTV